MRQAGQVEPAEQPSDDPVVERRRRIDALVCNAAVYLPTAKEPT